MDDAAQSAERQRPGARQDTADRPFRFAWNGADAEVQTRKAKSNPDLKGLSIFEPRGFGQPTSKAQALFNCGVRLVEVSI